MTNRLEKLAVEWMRCDAASMNQDNQDARDDVARSMCALIQSGVLKISDLADQPEIRFAVINSQAGVDHYDNLHSVLCIHEYVLEQAEVKGSYWYNISERSSVDELRHAVIERILPDIQAAFNTVKDQYNDCFDFEFVPRVLASIKDPIAAETEAFIAAAAVELQRSEQECKTSAAQAGDGS
ncbi:MAG: hypothetical protein JKY60_19595 [Kordiimonadaceae bacterium]|nr:hypothetical protein [Kordiimonadaceae bacterium]